MPLQPVQHVYVETTEKQLLIVTDCKKKFTILKSRLSTQKYVLIAIISCSYSALANPASHEANKYSPLMRKCTY